MTGEKHRKNTYMEGDEKSGHHKFGKKPQKNENKIKKKQHKKRSVHKKAGLPAIQELLGQNEIVAIGALPFDERISALPSPGALRWVPSESNSADSTSRL